MKNSELLNSSHVDSTTVNFKPNLIEVSNEDFDANLERQNELLMKQNQFLSDKVMELEKRMEEQLFRQLDLIVEHEEFMMGLDDYVLVNEVKQSFGSYEYEKLQEEYQKLQLNYETFRNSKFGKLARKYWKLLKYLKRK
ncbi:MULTISPECIES: hypothetical protein [Bacillaceae]|uniref:Uncharacterized protein n=1 Tax=Gottfriedia luciferensis TaxID=178774 RepID=A0ABX2ZNK2_9BACI|nr:MULTISPECIES: hypothetical protein [Bacillaceae]ODG90087.1 hypothetical protein BED47_14590 [Gottfriedia luciferensis]PGZ91699.1 hypothetical protein COE53_13565 [Bacillus sp. AFS029533]SFD10341.1 hypothetical protein SAMN02799633_02640 [Bacillus sp. UNCCL81]